jgi:hypothetical protein
MRVELGVDEGTKPAYTDASFPDWKRLCGLLRVGARAESFVA